MTATIRGYRLLGPLTSGGGGQCQWAFAERRGRSYFLKQFLTPTYPVKGSPGSEAMKSRKLEQCHRFEAHHKGMLRALQSVSGEGGNLVVTLEFFRDGTRYYKTTAKVDGLALSPDGSGGLEIRRRVAVPVAVAGSLQILHRMRIVHGDLKPANILVQEGARPTPKLIDFDNAFRFGEPPAPDGLVGDAVYYSPELLSYVTSGKDGNRLSGASDVFALGLVFAEYLTGSLPHTEKGRYAAEILADGGELSLASEDGLPPRLVKLLTSMLLFDPEMRPTMPRVWSELKEVQAGRDLSPPSPPAEPRRPRLRGALAERLPVTTRSGLRGTLRPKVADSGLAECEPALAKLRHGAEPNSSVRDFWELAQAIIGDSPGTRSFATRTGLVAMLPVGLRTRYEALKDVPDSDARAWVAALLTGATPSLIALRRLRPRPQPILSCGNVCSSPPIPEIPPIVPRTEGSPEVVVASPSDEALARDAWGFATGSGDAKATALAWMRLRALATSRLGTEEVEAGRRAVRTWGSSL